MSAVVYRMRADDGSLLYVGCTKNLKHRMAEHKSVKPWWNDVASVDVDEFDDRADALLAEAEAIGTENPQYNVHNPHRARLVGGRIAAWAAEGKSHVTICFLLRDEGIRVDPSTVHRWLKRQEKV